MLSLLNSIFIIICTSFLTAIFSFWNYRSGRWWELKVTTYSNIMQSLHYIKKRTHLDYDNYLEAINAPDYHEGDTEYEEYDHDIFQNKNRSKEAITRLTKIAESSLEEIEKAIDVASFIIKQEALDELIKLKTVYEQAFNFDELNELFDQTKNQKKIVNDCLSQLRFIAKNELEATPNNLLSRFKDWIKEKLIS